MKKLFLIQSYKCLDYPVKKQLTLLNGYVTISNHFPGVWAWGITTIFERGCNGLINFWKYWQLGYGNDTPIMTNPGRLESIQLRFGRPLICIHLTKKCRNRNRESMKHYLINS